MLATRPGRRVTGDDGASAVEFALVVPILLILVFGIINFGFLFTSQITLNTSARDAARLGVVSPVTGSPMSCSAIALAARNNAGTLGAPASQVAVTVTGPTVGGSSISCAMAAGSTTVTGSGSSFPCTGSSALSSPQLLVTTSTQYRALMPLVPPYSTTLNGTGKFQCEYN